MDLMRIVRGGTPIELDRPRILYFGKDATAALAMKLGPQFLTKIYAYKGGDEFELIDVDALQFALWAGLQAEAKAKSEELTYERCEDFFVPTKFQTIFRRVIVALGGAIQSPPGKDEAAAETLAATATKPKGTTKASTTRKRSASPTASSGKPRKSSGRAR